MRDGFGYALWDSKKDWFRVHPATDKPLVFATIKELLAVRAKFLETGTDASEAEPVELGQAGEVLRSVGLDETDPFQDED